MPGDIQYSEAHFRSHGWNKSPRRPSGRNVWQESIVDTAPADQDTSPIVPSHDACCRPSCRWKEVGPRETCIRWFLACPTWWLQTEQALLKDTCDDPAEFWHRTGCCNVSKELIGEFCHCRIQLFGNFELPLTPKRRRLAGLRPCPSSMRGFQRLY